MNVKTKAVLFSLAITALMYVVLILVAARMADHIHHAAGKL